MMKKFKKSNDYVITAEKYDLGKDVYNHLEDCHYVTSSEKNIVLTGTVGEQWVVTEDKLRSTYCRTDGSEIDSIPKTAAFLVSPKPSADVVFAKRTSDEMVITTSWGEKLHANREGIPHGEGDYIVYASKDGKPDLEDCWVVNGEVFPRTYEEVE